MADRIDAYLKGDLGATALTPQERLQADTVGRVAGELRRFVAARPAPDLSASIMRRIEQLGPPGTAHADDDGRRSVWARLTEALWAPRQVSLRFRPAYAAAAVAAIVLLAVFAPLRGRLPVAVPTGGAGAPQVFVQFRLDTPHASDVRLAGSFTNWQPAYALNETSPGVWTVTLPLAPGVHQYGFVVDGRQWVPDPHARQVNDGFGGVNSQIALLPPETPRS